MTKWKAGDPCFARLKHEKLLMEPQTRPARIISVFEARGVWYAWIKAATLMPANIFEKPSPKKWIVGDWPQPVLVTDLDERSGPAIPGLDDEDEEEDDGPPAA